MRAGIGSRIGLGLGATLAGAIVVELALVVFAPVPLSIEHNMYFGPDPRTGFRLEPSGRGFFQGGIPADANSRGYRDDPLRSPSDAADCRVLAIGDSFTVGANVEQSQAYPQVLEGELSRRLDADVEVVNTGVGGWEPFQYAQYYEGEGRGLEADAVLVGFFVGNDAYDRLDRVEDLRTARLGRRVSREAAASPWLGLRVALYRSSHLARRLTDRGPVQESYARRDCRDFSEQYLEIERQRLLNHRARSPETEAESSNALAQMIRLREATARDGVPLYVALLPDELQVNAALRGALGVDPDDSTLDFSMPQSMIRERFEAAGLVVFDLLDAIVENGRCLYMNDTHWNAEGHALVSLELADALTPDLRRLCRRPLTD